MQMRTSGAIESHNKHNLSVWQVIDHIIRISDIVMEVLDARFIKETRNMELEAKIKEQGKGILYIINKIDLLDKEQLRALKEKVELENIKPSVLVSCTSHKGRHNLKERIKIEVKRRKIKFPKSHVGIIGYPNTGKSTLINLITGRHAVRTSPRAGLTQGMHKIRINSNILLLDTPGVIPNREDAKSNALAQKKHTKMGVATYDRIKDPIFAVVSVMKENPGKVEKLYGIEANGDVELLLETLGKQRNMVKRGNKTDLDRAARVVLKDWQEGKIK
ncbi:MAG: GTPase [archaeon]